MFDPHRLNLKKQAIKFESINTFGAGKFVNESQDAPFCYLSLK